jgi:predicted MFS family arabinose efflux permease
MAAREAASCLAAVDSDQLPAKQWCFWVAGGMACYYAFLPLVYAELLGLSASDIGVLCGVAPLVSALATPLWAAVADAGNCHRALVLATLASSAGLHCLLPLCPRSMAYLLPLVVISEAVGAPCVPLADAAIGLTLQV